MPQLVEQSDLVTWTDSNGRTSSVAGEPVSIAVDVSTTQNIKTNSNVAKRVLLVGYEMGVLGSASAQWKSSGGTVKSGILPGAVGGLTYGSQFPYNYIISEAGEGLQLEAGAGGSGEVISGHCIVALVDA